MDGRCEIVTWKNVLWMLIKCLAKCCSPLRCQLELLSLFKGNSFYLEKRHLINLPGAEIPLLLSATATVCAFLTYFVVSLWDFSFSAPPKQSSTLYPSHLLLWQQSFFYKLFKSSRNGRSHESYDHALAFTGWQRDQ